jgi:hypothetical protein
MGAFDTDREQIVGVCIVGRPVARALDDGWTAEVLRIASDGSRNVCSLLYGAAWRAVRAVGYQRIITYTLESEGGASLRASGWERVADLPARRGWDAPSRPRNNDTYLSADRVRWQKGEPATWGRPAEFMPVPTGDENQMDLLGDAA